METAYMTLRLAAILCLLSALSIGRAMAAVIDSVPTTAAQIEEFVQAIWIEGVPYDIASRIPPEVALPVLQKILNDPAASPYWANAAVTIGMIGEARGADILIDFIQRGDAKVKLDSDQTRAKTSAVMSLGYIVHKSSNRKALDLLSAATDPAFWSGRKIAWTSVFHANLDDRNFQLASMAVLGLGVSGNADAAKKLQSLAARKGNPEFESVVREALWANEAIAKEGLRDYYRTRVKEPQRNLEATQPWEQPPVEGEILREAKPGEILKQAAPGELLAQPRAGEVLRQAAPGAVLSEQPPEN